MTGRPAAHDRALLGLLAVVLVVGVLGMPALRYDGDANAWEMEAESLVLHGRLEVDPAVAENVSAKAPYFIFNRETGRWHSKYGIGNTLIYAAPLLFERFVLGIDTPTEPHGVFGKPGGGVYRIDRRLLLFNGFNILLGLLLALTLYRIAALYSPSALARVLYVLACFYSTYLWNYLRAQSSQIYQCLLFSAALLFLLRFERAVAAQRSETPLSPAESRDLLWSSLAIAALCLVKSAYLPLLGIWAVAIAWAGWRRGQPVLAFGLKRLTTSWRTLGLYALLPIACALAILSWSNALKFGGPFAMGYGREASLWGADLGESIPGYLFHPRYSVFVHFPLLAIALFGLAALGRRARFMGIVTAACFAVMFAINASYTFWKGEACVGPRYLLFVLPALSLPAVFVFEWIAARPHWLARAIPTALITLLLGSSTLAQHRINTLEFHTFFRWRVLFESSARDDPAIFAYFDETRTARVHADFIAYGEGGEAPLPIRRLRDRMSAQDFARVDDLVRAHLANGNYYFGSRKP